MKLCMNLLKEKKVTKDDLLCMRTHIQLFNNFDAENLNFVNLSFMMCLMSEIILQHYRIELQNPPLNILDLKVIFNAQYIAKNLVNTYD